MQCDHPVWLHQCCRRHSISTIEIGRQARAADAEEHQKDRRFARHFSDPCLVGQTWCRRPPDQATRHLPLIALAFRIKLRHIACYTLVVIVIGIDHASATIWSAGFAVRKSKSRFNTSANLSFQARHHVQVSTARDVPAERRVACDGRLERNRRARVDDRRGVCGLIHQKHGRTEIHRDRHDPGGRLDPKRRRFALQRSTVENNPRSGRFPLNVPLFRFRA